jgi:inner membrane protein
MEENNPLSATPESHHPTPSIPKNTSFFAEHRILIKGMGIAILIAFLMIPTVMIRNLIEERLERQQIVIDEVSSKWATEQTINGPILMLPYTVAEKTTNDKIVYQRYQAYFLPDQLQINSVLSPQQRERSIYTVLLYQTQTRVKGYFPAINFDKLNIVPHEILWKEAQLLVGIDDIKGLQDEVKLQWNQEEAPLILESNLPNNEVVTNGLSTAIPLAGTESRMPFDLLINLKGSTYLYFTPLGKTTTVQMTSNWNSPMFDGQYLPNEKPKVTDTGFEAHWKIMQANRGFRQSWISGNKPNIHKAAFGVQLIQPADFYAKTERSVKYAILFISLTFAIFFFIEMLQKKHIHVLQYVLVGLALLIFFSLLLSISEYIGFNKAYAIATVATVALIGSFVWSVFQKGSIASGFTFALSALYGYIFFLIQLQDYALLVGSIGLFILLAVAMYFSRKIDWYSKK